MQVRFNVLFEDFDRSPAHIFTAHGKMDDDDDAACTSLGGGASRMYEVTGTAAATGDDRFSCDSSSIASTTLAAPR